MHMNSREIEEDDHWQHAMQLASASILRLVLKATIEFGVLDIIEKAGPGAQLSPSQIADQLQLVDQNKPECTLILDRILRLLASYSILNFSLATNNHDGQVQRLYGLAPVAKYFVRNQDGRSFAPLLDLIQDKVMLNIWYYLKDAVLEGELAFNRAYEMKAVEYMGKDTKLREIFKASMRDFNPKFC